jgi:hypothetical protein
MTTTNINLDENQQYQTPYNNNLLLYSTDSPAMKTSSGSDDAEYDATVIDQEYDSTSSSSSSPSSSDDDQVGSKTSGNNNSSNKSLVRKHSSNNRMQLSKHETLHSSYEQSERIIGFACYN